MIFLLTQSHYEPLIKCGVKIYQYTPGFIHAKSFLCDDKIGTVGSINLDYRSLFLHFECGVFMYKTKALMQLKEDCVDTFAASEEMTLEFCRGQNVFIRIFQGMMRLFAPLLYNGNKGWRAGERFLCPLLFDTVYLHFVPVIIRRFMAGTFAVIP